MPTDRFGSVVECQEFSLWIQGTVYAFVLVLSSLVSRIIESFILGNIELRSLTACADISLGFAIFSLRFDRVNINAWNRRT